MARSSRYHRIRTPTRIAARRQVLRRETQQLMHELAR